MPIKKIIILVFILFTSFAQLVWAKTNNNKSELTVEADESLEWFENISKSPYMLLTTKVKDIKLKKSKQVFGWGKSNPLNFIKISII